MAMDMAMVDMVMVAMDQRGSRIAKNTLMLYIRMFITMGIGLYTGRVILDALGVEDFGIYNVVAGVVGMFSLLTGSLSSAISRFITFEIGSGNVERLRRVFSTSIVIQIVLAVLIAILVESVGLWFLNNKLVIPPDRMYAARWVLHISTLTCVIGLLKVPYNATIIAHERMSLFAILTVVESISKLAVAYFIMISPIDRLIFYAILTGGVSLVISGLYFVYGRVHFQECRNIKLRYHKSIFREMFSFAGWNFIGSSSAVLRDQGINILLNLFWGATVNAARGVSMQVVNAITQFSSNFMIALTPQITKSYASGDMDYMMRLVFRGSRFSFYLLLILSLPIFLNTSYILNLWLKEVPEYTVLFIQLTIVYCLIETLSRTLITSMAATGKIRNYQIIVGGVGGLLNFPLAYLVLWLGARPEMVVVTIIFASLVCLGLRLYLLRGMIGLSAKKFLRDVVLNVIKVTALSLFVPFVLDSYLDEGMLSLVLTTMICVVTTGLAVYFVGCDRYEREFFRGKIDSILKFHR